MEVSALTDMLPEQIRDKLGMSILEEPDQEVAEEIEQSGAGAEEVIQPVHHHDKMKPKPKCIEQSQASTASLERAQATNEQFDVEADEACFEDSAEAKMKSRITTKMGGKQALNNKFPGANGTGPKVNLIAPVSRKH